MQRSQHLARVLVARTRPALGFLIGIGALLLLALIHAAILDLLAGHAGGAVVLVLIVVVAWRALRGRND